MWGVGIDSTEKSLLPLSSCQIRQINQVNVTVTFFVLIKGPVKIIIFLKTMYEQKLFTWWYIGVIKEGVLTEVGPVIRAKTVCLFHNTV